MSIEVLMTSLIEALNANTAALTGKASTGKKTVSDDGDDAAPAKKTATRGRKAASDEGDDEEKAPAKKTTTKKITREDLTTIFNKVKEDLGTPVAKKIIESMGVERLAEIDDEDIEAAYKKAKAKLDAASKEDDDGDI